MTDVLFTKYWVDELFTKDSLHEFLCNLPVAFGSEAAPGMTAPHVAFVRFARYVYESGTAAPNYSIYGII